MHISEAPRRYGRELTRESSHSNHSSRSQAHLEYTESQNRGENTTNLTRRKKDKAIAHWDLDDEKAREIRELVKTRAHFEHMMSHLYKNLHIPPSPQEQPEDQVENHHRNNHTQADHGELSQHGKILGSIQLKEHAQEPPRSHHSDRRSTASNKVEGQRSQLDGLVYGDLRYSLMAKR